MTHSALPLSPSDVVIIAVVLPTLALIAFTLRVLDRRRRHVSASWHEWTLAAGLLFLWSLAITCFVGKTPSEFLTEDSSALIIALQAWV